MMKWQSIQRLGALALGLVAVLIILAWPDLKCLLLIAYNYCYWPLYHRSFNYIDNRDSVPTPTSPVPKILHQSWKTSDIPVQWKSAQQSCMNIHQAQGYEYKLWTDAAAEELILSKYPWFISTYRSYPHAIQRADSARYFILHQYGGIYLDLDIFCLTSLDFLRSSSGAFVAPKTSPIGVSNDLLVSSPGHPFASRLILNLKSWSRSFFLLRYTTVMFSTGPMFVTIQLALHPNKSEVEILAPQLYGKYKSGAVNMRAVVAHLKGSSWHGNDAPLFLFINRNGSQLMLGLTILLAAIALLIFFRRYFDGQLVRAGAEIKEV